MGTRLSEITKLLSDEIEHCSSRKKLEEFQPSMTPDESNDYIKDLSHKITTLRGIRVSLEDLLS